MRAWTPEPTNPIERASGRPSAREATAAAAPVRTAVNHVASSTASGRAVAGSERMKIPITAGSPWRDGFCGCELTHVTPAAPSRNDGIARKSPPCSGSGRYTFGGMRV